jgi:hypothetical protein
MADRIDPVDRALQSLAGRQWPGTNYNHELEQNLMDSFEHRPQASLFARHRVLVSVLAVLAVAGAAAGAVGLAKGWFATVEVNGQVVHSGEIVPDENGQATIVVPAGTLRDGENEVTVSLEAGDNGPKTVTVTAEGNQVTIQKETKDPPAQDGGK